MDRTTQKAQKIEKLIRAADEARFCLTGEVTSLRARFDLPSRLRGSLKSHPTGWLFGTFTVGFAASLLFRRKPARVDHVSAEKKPRGLVLTLFGLLLTVVRPLLKIWFSGQLKNYLTGQLQSHSADYLAARKSDPANTF